MNKSISVLLIIAGIIHLLPVTGVLGAEHLSGLYDVIVTGPDLEILLRHRAVLFGLLGLFLIFAAFKAEYQLAALTAGIISALSFILIALSVGAYNEAIYRVILADIVALIMLAIAALLFFIRHKAKK